MKVILIVDITDEDRRAIRAAAGKPGLASIPATVYFIRYGVNVLFQRTHQRAAGKKAKCSASN